MITATLSITQGTDKTKFTVTDATNYSIGEPIDSMTEREVVIYKSDGTVLVDHVFSGYSTSFDVENIEKDVAIKAVFTITPPVIVGGSTYTTTVYQSITGYSMTCFFDRHVRMMNNLRLENNRDYLTDNYRILMESEASAAASANEDISAAQLCLDRIYKIYQTNKLPY